MSDSALSSSVELRPSPSNPVRRSDLTSSDIPQQRRTALMFIGNTGAGKSALLNQLGGNFPSGMSSGHGVTTGLSEVTVDLDGEAVVLMDVPGLNDPRKEVNERNARILTEALGRGYNYKLIFVLWQSNRTVDAADMALVQRVNDCLRNANIIGDGGAYSIDGAESSRLSFSIIVNGIQGQVAYHHYERHREDKFQSIFEDLHTPDVPFDIKVDSVLLLRHNDVEVAARGLKKILTDFVRAQRAVPISVEGDIIVSDEHRLWIRLALEVGKGLAIGAVLAVCSVVKKR